MKGGKGWGGRGTNQVNRAAQLDRQVVLQHAPHLVQVEELVLRAVGLAYLKPTPKPRPHPTYLHVYKLLCSSMLNTKLTGRLCVSRTCEKSFWRSLGHVYTPPLAARVPRSDPCGAHWRPACDMAPTSHHPPYWWQAELCKSLVQHLGNESEAGLPGEF